MNLRLSRLAQIVLMSCLMLVALLPCRAQNTSAGALSGTVKDASGAVIAGATVTVTNQGTHAVSTATTTGKGFYTVENLPDGDYTLAATASGFSGLTIRDIHLDPGQRRGQDVNLKTGAVTSEVDVQADTVAVQTESPESGGTISAKEVQNLMINGRNFQQLATLVPGVSSTKGTNAQMDSGYLGQTFLVVGGASSEETTYTIDGVYNMTPTSLINVNITPSIDIINEMRVLKNAYSAKYGYAGSGQIMIETKQGTSQYHGSGYEYIRNNSFAVAKPYSLSGQPITQSGLHFNIFGFSFGGPVFIPKVYPARDKTFFESGAEWKVNHYSVGLNSRSEFTQAIRNGDLSAAYTGTTCITYVNGVRTVSAAAAAAGCTLADTDTLRYLTCDSTCQTLFANNPKPGLSASTCFFKDANGVTNQLSPACFDPASAYFIDPNNQFLPLPNVPQNNNTKNANYVNNNPERDLTDDIFARIDHHIGDKHTLTARYMYEEVNDVRPARNYNDPSPNPGAIAYTPAMNALLRWNYNITPTIINTAGLAYTYQKVELLPTGSYNIPSGLIKQAFNNGDTRLPAVSIGSYWSWLGVGAQPNFSKTGDGIFSDDFTWVHGRHVVQAGGLYMWNILRLNSNAFAQGNFSFNGSHTGDVAGDFLLGFLASYSQSNVQRSGVFHQHWYDLYAQDDWKATPRLLLSYGVRYSFYSPATKEGNDVTNFDASTFNPAVAPVVGTNGKFTYNASGQPLTASGAVANYLTNGIVYACQNGTPCGFTTPKKNLFAPRVGFAYRLNDAGTMSLHGGYGIGYTQVGMFQTSGLISNNPYVSTPSYTNTQFSSPVGAVAGQPGLQSVSGLDGTYRPAMLQSWSLTFEQELFHNAIMQVAYAGDKIDHIFSSNVDRNFPLNGTSASSATCNADPNNPATVPQSAWMYDPCINNTGKLQVVSNYYRPYSGYSAISTGASIGSSNYHALQTAFNYKTRDLQVKTGYTFSKALGTQNQTNTGSAAYAFDSNVGFQNPRNPAADYGRPNYDRTHVFTNSYVYELPFFRHSHNFLLREFVGGWGNSGLLTIQSGFAQGVGISSPYAGLANRANQVGPIIRNSHTSGKQFQQRLYEPSSFGLPGFGTFGNSQPGVLRGPREVSFATAMNKNFPIYEDVVLQFRAEAFNVFNHPNINGFNSTISNVTTTTNSQFGYATSVGDMRVMEFSARVTF